MSGDCLPLWIDVEFLCCGDLHTLEVLLFFPWLVWLLVLVSTHPWRWWKKKQVAVLLSSLPVRMLLEGVEWDLPSIWVLIEVLDTLPSLGLCGALLCNVVVTENEESLCAFIQWFLAKASNFIVPSGINLFYLLEHSYPSERNFLVYPGFNYNLLFYCEDLALFYGSKCGSPSVARLIPRF